MNYPLTATETQAADVYHAREVIVADLQHLINTIQTCPASQLWAALNAAQAQSETIGNDANYPARFPVDMSNLKTALDAIAETGNSDAANTSQTIRSAAWGCADPFGEPEAVDMEELLAAPPARKGGRITIVAACPADCECPACQAEEAYHEEAYHEEAYHEEAYHEEAYHEEAYHEEAYFAHLAGMSPQSSALTGGNEPGLAA